MSTDVNLERNNSICSEGVHTFKIVKSEEKMGGSGYPYWNFELTCVDEGPDKGQKLWAMVSLAPPARFKVDQFLDAVGAPPKGSVTHENFVGKTFRASVVWETYNGATKAKPDNFIPVNAPETKSKAAKTSEAHPEQSLPEDSTNAEFTPPF